MHMKWALLTVIVLGTSSTVAPAFEPPVGPAIPAKNGQPGIPATSGGTRSDERAINAATFWLSKHQMPDGRWTLDAFDSQCKDASCTGPGSVKADSAATGLALLTFLAAGQNHQKKGLYQKGVQEGLDWLVQQQKADGDLRAGSTMYAHGMAALALSEAYAITKDQRLARPVQQAVAFLEKAQHPKTGGWRYSPGEEGDTSVFSWQCAALCSAKLAGLEVSPAALDGARRWLDLVAVGQHKGLYCYTTGSGPSPSMTAVGLLCRLLLSSHAYRPPGTLDPATIEGRDWLMQQLPDPGKRQAYHWYHATAALSIMPGEEWDRWHRHIRKLLVATQTKEGCATGSWSPSEPSADPVCAPGGRLVVTCLSALTLAVAYRQLPLYGPPKPMYRPNGRY